jgi:hypothetical protein
MTPQLQTLLASVVVAAFVSAALLPLVSRLGLYPQGRKALAEGGGEAIAVSDPAGVTKEAIWLELVESVPMAEHGARIVLQRRSRRMRSIGNTIVVERFVAERTPAAGPTPSVSTVVLESPDSGVFVLNSLLPDLGAGARPVTGSLSLPESLASNFMFAH